MRGRPSKSKIRNRIASILQYINSSYGYDLYKKYRFLFGEAKMRTVYYNLRKGVMLNEFIVSDIKREIGEYTWGSETERVYYTNGPYANPVQLDEIQIKKLEKYEKTQKTHISQEQIEKLLQELKMNLEEYVSSFRELAVSIRVKRYQTIEERINKLKRWIGKEEEITAELNKMHSTLKRYEY